MLALTCARRRDSPLQTGSDPKLGADEDYPAWLWTLREARPTASELERKVAGVPRGDRFPVTLEEGMRLLTLRRKGSIKAENGRAS